MANERDNDATGTQDETGSHSADSMTEAAIRARALARFPGAWGGEYDEDDDTDRFCLEDLIRQERALIEKEESGQ